MNTMIDKLKDLFYKHQHPEYGEDFIARGVFPGSYKDLANDIIELFNSEWISVDKSLPSFDNGFIDETVLIAVKNKNKEDGIYLYDVCSFDGESWSKARVFTWEDILFWKPIPKMNKEIKCQ